MTGIWPYKVRNGLSEALGDLYSLQVLVEDSPDLAEGSDAILELIDTATVAINQLFNLSSVNEEGERFFEAE